MQELKKDHSIGAGTGATAGAAAGALLGAAAGPIGATIGALLGGIGGAKAGDAIAEHVNPTEYDAYWQANFKTRPYYKDSYGWDDYAPAYGMGYYARNHFRGRKFDDIDDHLEAAWEKAKGKSRLAYAEAREAIRDGWHHVERALPGDFDNDGR